MPSPTPDLDVANLTVFETNGLASESKSAGDFGLVSWGNWVSGMLQRLWQLRNGEYSFAEMLLGSSTLTSGSGAPAGGANGDFYFRTDTGALYARTGGAWAEVSGGGGSGGATTVYETNFIDETNASYTTDGDRTIDGVSWTVENTSGNTMGLDDDGLSMETSTGGTTTGPYISATCWDELANWDISRNWRLTVRYELSGGSGAIFRMGLSTGSASAPMTSARLHAVSVGNNGTHYVHTSASGFQTFGIGRSNDNVLILEHRGGSLHYYTTQRTDAAGTLPTTSHEGMIPLTPVDIASGHSDALLSYSANIGPTAQAQKARLYFGVTESGSNNKVSVEAFKIEQLP